MAILDELGIEATIVVDDAALVEYDDLESENTDGRPTLRSHKYVASQDNKLFSIKITATKDFKWANQAVNFGLSFEVFVDGRQIDCPVARPEDLEYGSFSYQINGRTEKSPGGEFIILRKCCFSPVSLGRSSSIAAQNLCCSNTLTKSTADHTDEATMNEYSQNRMDIGLIRVLVFREKILAEAESPTERDGSPSLPSRLSILPETVRLAEEDIKGTDVSHVTL